MIGSLLTDLWALLSSINPTVAAALIVLIGTFLTLWLNRFEQRRQQLIDLRRDVYLSASDTLASLLQALNNLTDRRISLAQLRDFLQRFAGHVGKLHLLGDTETVAELIAFQRAFLEEHFLRIQPKVRLDVMVSDQQHLVNHSARLQERRATLARFWETNLFEARQGMPAEQITERLNILRAEQADIDRVAHILDVEQRDLETLTQQLEMQLFEMSPEIARRLNPPLVRLVLQLRRELGITSDESWYTAAMNSLTDSNDIQQHSFINDYRQFSQERAQREQHLLRRLRGEGNPTEAGP